MLLLWILPLWVAPLLAFAGFAARPQPLSRVTQRYVAHRRPLRNKVSAHRTATHSGASRPGASWQNRSTAAAQQRHPSQVGTYGAKSPQSTSYSQPVLSSPAAHAYGPEPASQTAVAPPPDTTPAGTDHAAALPPAPAQPFAFAEALTPFFHALRAEQELRSNPTLANTDGGLPRADETVRALQFGDSHTAADLFTGELRAHLQAHFGDGGLGFQYPGHPFAGYRLAGSTRSQSSGWVTEGTHFQSLGDAELGLGGVSISTSRPGERITLGTTCTTLRVNFLRQPGGGRLRLSVDGEVVSEFETNFTTLSDAQTTGYGSGAATSSAAGSMTYSCTAGEHQIELTTLDEAPVRLFGLVTEQPGVTYECLGINGAVAPLILRWNQPLFTSYLRERDPALIVLAYGTNEAVYIASHAEEYAAQFHQLLQELHHAVPDASVLVLGPYDRAVRAAIGTVGRGRRAHMVYGWHTFAGTERVAEIQRNACQRDGCAFYDEQARMGGAGSMLRWAAAGLAQGDHTHLTGAGYRTLADALYADLLAAYTQSGSAMADALPSRKLEGDTELLEEH